MEATLQIRKRGTLTLPADLRAKYGIRPGDTFQLVDLDGGSAVDRNSSKIHSTALEGLNP